MSSGQSLRGFIAVLCGALLGTLATTGCGSATRHVLRLRATNDYSHSLPAATWLRGWPMVGHDAQRTNRSPDRGPLRPHLIWTRKDIESSPAVDADGRIVGWASASLLALDRTGHKRWGFTAWEGDGGPPALGPSGHVGVLSLPVNVVDPNRSNVVVLTENGTPLWQRGHRGFSKGAAPLWTSNGDLAVPLVGPAVLDHPYGGLLLMAPPRLTSVTLLAGSSVEAVAQAPNGTLYVAVANTSTGTTRIMALNPSGRRLWAISDPEQSFIFPQLMVGRDASVYVAGGGAVIAYSPSGKRRWQNTKSDGARTLAERANGIVLVAGTHWLDAYAASGRHLWRVGVGTSSTWSPAMAIDATGRVYVASDDGQLVVISNEGKVVGRLAVGPKIRLPSAPSVAIGPYQELIVVGPQGALRMYGPSAHSS